VAAEQEEVVIYRASTTRCAADPFAVFNWTTYVPFETPIVAASNSFVYAHEIRQKTCGELLSNHPMGSIFVMHPHFQPLH
jgi:hypothetical protein